MRIVILVFVLLSTTRAFVPRNAPVQASAVQLRVSQSDYEHAVDSLQKELHKAHETLKKVEILAARLQEMERKSPQVARVRRNLPLQQAVAEAKAAVHAYGSTSPEAQNALKHVNKLADERHPYRVTAYDGSTPAVRYKESAVESHHAYNAIVDPKLLEDSMQAIEDLMVLEHFVEAEQARLDAEGRHKPDPQDSVPGMPWGLHH